MSIYDIVMLIVMVGAIWFGYWKGLAWQIASVAAIAVSYFVSVNFRDVISPYIQTSEPWNRIGAMLILFLGTSLIIWTIYASIAKSLKKNELKGFDRQAGAMLGAVKGALLCMVITMFAVSIMGEKAHDAVHTSTFGPYVESGIWNVSAFVPEEIAQFVDPHLENYKAATGHKDAPIIQTPWGQAEHEHDSNPNLGNPLNAYPAGGQVGGQNGAPNNQQNYPGTWLPPNTTPRFQAPAQPAGFQQPQQNGFQNNGFQNGAGYRQQPQTNQSTWNNQTQQTQQQPQTNTVGWDSSFNASDATKELLEPWRQAGQEIRQQGQELIRQQGTEFFKGTIEKAADNLLGSGK